MVLPRPLRREWHGQLRLMQWDTHWSADCEACGFRAPFVSEQEARDLVDGHDCPD